MHSLASGTLFADDYRVIKRLSEGGMGALYTAEQLSTGKVRALKLMQPALVAEPKHRERFAREARVGARIDSDHIVEVVAAGIDAATQAPWLAMELLEGEELGALLARRGHLPAGEVAEIMRQLCHGLGAAHAAGVVHRDLKPENIFLAKARRAEIAFTVKILDFGIARIAAEAKTQSTDAMGSPFWMSPEQAEHGASISAATDVWALGLIAFKALTGSSFWLSASDPEPSALKLLKEIAVDPIPLCSVRAAALGVGERLPDGFDAWFARCVTRTVADRFEDATATFRALAPILDASPSMDAPHARARAGFDRGSATVGQAPIDAATAEAPIITVPAEAYRPRIIPIARVVVPLGAVFVAAVVLWSVLRAKPTSPTAPSASARASASAAPSASAQPPPPPLRVVLRESAKLEHLGRIIDSNYSLVCPEGEAIAGAYGMASTSSGAGEGKNVWIWQLGLVCAPVLVERREDGQPRLRRGATHRLPLTIGAGKDTNFEQLCASDAFVTGINAEWRPRFANGTGPEYMGDLILRCGHARIAEEAGIFKVTILTDADATLSGTPAGLGLGGKRSTVTCADGRHAEDGFVTDLRGWAGALLETIEATCGAPTIGLAKASQGE